MSPPQTKLNALTSLRFFAAFAVVLSHSGYFPQSDIGQIGVAFFFILSGFVLSFAYQNLLKRGMSKSDFWIARIARIYPLHFLMMMVFALFQASLFLKNMVPFEEWNEELLTPFIFHLTLTQSWFSDKIIWSYNIVSWTLAVEFLFYFLFPFLVLLSPKKLIVLFILSFFCVLSLYQYQSHMPVKFFYSFPLLRMPDLLLGMVLFDVYKRFSGFKHFQETVCNFFQISALALLVACYLLFNSFKEEIHQFFPHSSFFLPVLALLIFAFSLQKGFIKKFLEIKPLVILGEASFGLYMIHMMPIRLLESRPLEHLLLFLAGDFAYWIKILIVITVSILASILSFYFFEKPMNTWVKKTFKRFKNRKEIMNSNL